MIGTDIAADSATGYTATDCFSGGGGSTHGLQQAGIKVVIAANHWSTAILTHRSNHPDVEHVQANLSETDFRTFPRTDIAWFSPSCVWHARSGGRKKPPPEVERLRADEGSIDRATAFAVIAATEVHRYEIVAVENVAEFLDWTLFSWWLDGMTIQGYKHQIVTLDSADIGPDPVPQRRKRVYILFTRVDAADIDLTVDQVDRTPASAILLPDRGKLVTRRMYVTPQFEEITEPHVPHLVTYRNHAHARRADRHQLATITSGGNHHAVATLDAAGRVYHRWLTNLERARAQGFPDSFVFHGGHRVINGKRVDEVRTQIGNAVSVNVAKWLGHRIVAALNTSADPTSLYQNGRFGSTMEIAS